MDISSLFESATNHPDYTLGGLVLAAALGLWLRRFIWRNAGWLVLAAALGAGGVGGWHAFAGRSLVDSIGLGRALQAESPAARPATYARPGESCPLGEAKMHLKNGEEVCASL